MKKDFDVSMLETGDYWLGYSEIKLLFNLGPFPGGGDCIIAEVEGDMTFLNSNDVIHDIDGYEIVVG